jgi:transcriptional regulator
MYAHPAFQTDRTTSLAFAAARGFGLVIACVDGHPCASPLPFRIDYAADGTPRAAFHVARNNPLAEAAAGGGHWLLAVQGADAYLSPDWYASPDQVPTWLYQSVHLAGPVRALAADELVAHLDDLSEVFETRLLSKPVWRVDKVAPARRKMLMKAILGIEMTIQTVEGSFKLNQHKSDADLVAVAQALAGQAGEASRTLAARMMGMRPHLAVEPGNAAV